ncbi:MAG: serine/threonine-protein kinase [Myxococcota bacterium]
MRAGRGMTDDAEEKGSDGDVIIDVDDAEEFAPIDSAPEPTDIVSPFSPGSFFGDRFRIDEILGVGAMGTVFRATDLRSTKPVALKILLKRAHNAEARDRFAREAEILSHLDDPGIVRIRGFGHASGKIPWLAMELLEGETLGARIRRKGEIATEELVPIVRAVCATLQAAHEAGVIHRDLKPDHIFFQPRNPASLVKIIDFGLSSATMGKKLTRTGTVIGTPRYMAPELLSSARNASPASDIYALAITVFEALTGESPFAASDQGQLLGAILQGKTKPLSEHRPDLPPEVDAVLKRAMSKEPTERPAPLDFAEEFASATGVSGARRPRFSSYDELPALTDLPQATPAARRTTYLLLAVVGTLVAVAGGLVGYFMLR